MQIYEWNEFLEHGVRNKPVSMTVGVFDGVHRGHKTLIQCIVSHSENTIPAAITFREPAHKSERAQFTLQSFEEKTAALEALGIKTLIVADFTEEFSRMTGIEFLETLCKCADIAFFAVGANFRCGCRLDTDAEAVKSFFAKKNIPAEIVPEVMHDGLPISSSRIREALAEGDIDLAEALIG